MEVKKIVEGMTAVEVAEVIDSNFKNQNKILEEDIAKQNNVIGVSEYKDFSEAEAVNVGDVRKYEGLLYECVEATEGAWDESKWKKTSFKDETEKKLSELKSKSVVIEESSEEEIPDVEVDLTSEALRKTPQVLSKSEQAQARRNIGAASLEENTDFKNSVNESIGEVSERVTELGSEVDFSSRVALATNVELYRGEILNAEAETQGKYYREDNLNHETDSTGGFMTIFYPVIEGEFYLIRGYAVGINTSVVSLTTNVNDTQCLKSVISSNDFDKKYFDTSVKITPEVGYIAISCTNENAVQIYRKKNESRLDDIEAELEIQQENIKKQEKSIEDLSDKAEVVDESIFIYTYDELPYSEIEEGKYYSPAGMYRESSGFSIKYYAVSKGQKVRLKGDYRGEISAFALLAEKGDNSSILYGLSYSFDFSSIDEIIEVPDGINWIAMTYIWNATTSVYLQVLKSRIELLENKITDNQWNGKRLLAIGDSITAQNYWQKRVGELLGMNVRTHAKGGIGIIQMVDGDGSGDTPEGYDPDNFGTENLYKLSVDDVKDVDVIILMGFYNTRATASSKKGELTDMYPETNTWFAQMNYAIKRVYEELGKANNYNCKVVLCSAHKYGKYQYSDISSYDDGDILLNVTKDISERHSLPLINLMHNGNVNCFNWDVYQNSNTPYNPLYIPSDGVNDGTNKPFESIEDAPLASSNNGKFVTIKSINGCYKSNGTSWIAQSIPYIWNADQLHLNQSGGYRLGDYIAKQLLVI